MTALLLPFHIAAGVVGLLLGYVALYAIKGGRVHRRSGLFFVYAMTIVGVLGMIISAARGVAPAVNIPAGSLTAYLVVTSLLTVRRRGAASRNIDVAGMTIALAIGIACLILGAQAVAGIRSRLAIGPFLIFGTAAFVAFAGDLRVIRSGAREGTARLARHLWRMCFALFLASISFYIGQAQVFPEPIRIMPLLAMPVFGVLIIMFYWLWRVRSRKRSPRMIIASATEAV